MFIKINEMYGNRKNRGLNSLDGMLYWTSSSEEIHSRKFKLPEASTKHYPRKNRYRFQHTIARSLLVDTYTGTWNSPNASSDCCCTSYKSFRTLSRSSKIMNALSSAHSSFRQDTVGIRKSLNFDSSPSPKGNSSYDENSTSSISTDASSFVLNLSSVDSTDSNVPMTSGESIDENQNQTPQQNRKSIYKTDIRDNMRSRTIYLMSLIKEQKEATNKNATQGSSRPFCSFNSLIESKLSSRIITASTPRNLSQEFNQELDDRSHTPENMINVLPESISSIKKSHKKEKLYSHEEQSSIQQMDVSIKNDNLHSRTAMESPGIDMIATSSCYIVSENESHKKNRNIKRTLIYNDEHCDTKSDSDHNLQQKTASTINDSLESELDQIESDKMQDIDSIDESCEEDMQVNVCPVDHNNEEKDCSNENVCNEEISQLLLQNESSSICNVNVTSENRIASPESSSNISQNANVVVTPENNVNMLKHVLTESIKKSHKKMKHGNRKMLFKTPIKDPHQKIGLTKSEITLEGVCNIDQDIESQTPDAIHVSSPQNSELDRPNTPENINSSRLLLLGFHSVKKSHKKDKRNKRTSNFIECHGYEYKEGNSLRHKYREEICRTLRKNKSPDISPTEKSVSTFLQSSTPKFPSAFLSLGFKDINDEFKIFTPIKKRRIPVDVTNYVSAAGMSQEDDESAQATSKEIDCSRCVTPVAHCSKLRKHDLTSERDNAKKSETDINVLKVTDTTNPKDKNGRSTPINMSTTELLCNIDSIKKSHKKDKHNRSKELILKKKRSYVEKSEHVNFGNNDKMLEEPTCWSLKHHFDKNCAEKEMCNVMCEKEKNKSYKAIVYDDPDDPQPSTSRGADNMENTKNTIKSKFLDTTPPNSLSAMKLMKLVQTTSIKKSHKKERDINAQTKYILMSQEHELSDDGSIFDEEERLDFIQNDSIAQDDI
ncbi:PREDICTED: uncharacterized protein LOC108759339 isoform X1 [Trachymyrmex cornetzi]|uniref:uncharacterized protein LOC108759339 isoform X1 n=1 Tax=Trachymyrmex cornetzi TaxID=471704 RepID=UPI00084F21A3|nr:PREDICTED: uncharacterized protein LOC108759339 isoform X1 [Trachymyrmex cornetzi]